MEIQDFKKYIDDPVKMQEDDFEKIQSLMEKYPFFHTANLLFVKAAHNINHEVYNTAISRVSASVPNREMLHELITLKEIKIIPTEKKEDKPEESQTRKDIRQKIQKRRDKRKVEKGEELKEDGKSRHESLIKSFFAPIFTKLRKTSEDYSVVIEREIITEAGTDTKVEVVVDERERKKIEREKRMAEKRRLRAEETSDEDREKTKLEREKKKAERNKRLAEKKRLKEIKPSDIKKTVEDKPEKELKDKKADIDSKVSDKKEIVNLETEKTKKNEIVKDFKTEIISDEILIESEIPEQIEKPESKSKEVINDEISIEKDDPFTKIITIPSGDEKKEIKSEVSDEILIETDSKPKTGVPEDSEKNKPDEKLKTSRAKRRAKKDQVIIEDIKIDADVSDSKEEGAVIESIYDKIISSKKPKTTADKNHVFIEITEDISGLIPEEEEIVSEIKSEEPQVKEDIKPDKKDSDIEIHIGTDIQSKKEHIKDKKEDIITETKSEESKIKEEEKQDSKDSEIEINDDKHDEIEFIVDDTTNIKPGIDDKKEEKVDEKVSIKESTEESFELIEKEDDKVELIDKKEETENIIVSKKEDKTSGIDKIDSKPEIKEGLKEKTGETKAANDVLARIAAFKNKKKNETIKKEPIAQNKIKETEETDETNELIQKFVDEKPGMKRDEIDESENIDISEESVQIKKPVITELMASIYINQGKNKQAIEIFEQLILKNPEKKDYFAAKIKETENLK